MSCCNTCQSKFSFFSKEHGCPACGFSYCSKCLKYEPEDKKSKQKICGPCFHKSKIKKSTPISIEDLPTPNGLDEPLVPFNLATKARVESALKHPITVYYNRLDKLRSGLDPADQEIVNRLKKLKDEDRQVPSVTEDEIRRRLALLRDQDPNVVNKPVNLNEIDSRTDKQKVDDLISQYLQELEISKNVSDESQNVDSEIEARLKSLKEFTVKLPLPPIDFSQFGTSSSGEDRPMDCSEDTHDDYSGDNQCCMCDNKKNLVKCKGCTDDLYCIGCFNDNHDEFELKKHKTVPFRP
ncbi:abscission/NoCut checkpoint regulator [Copidosoma floridanum]|uniref:abscission/NoCut checkpoint regulator n=1 Tax=Copidosoma floridanum TaxID=29053 RepID=UPI0006C9B185|nr:abscission/NoCut checkpoint regulator [Copidosoma floridanum]